MNQKDSLAISAKTGAGIDALLQRLSKEAERFAGEPALVTRARQKAALTEAAKLLAAAEHSAAEGEEIFAEYLRLAGRALGRVTGRVDIEDVLDQIFSSFCIGK